ncbi:MAG TPA: hypothetical protein VEZ52_05985 [Desulfovibrio sp.]|uniref:hypothetical protein n=1 Tax=Desulfovibrio sp. TaxID=885 RepID=UPI002D226606|nr:hypothetical protein [Desulfovibrio sp.]HZF61157.1 hypothetical protein [Desulfovibrio sp.]
MSTNSSDRLLPRDFKPHMSNAEFALLQKYTPTGTVLEFGAGGSSAFFAERGVEQLITVEADREWIHQLILGSDTLRQWVKKNRWKPIFADIGKIGEWSRPVSKVPSIQWLNYHCSVWNYVDIKKVNFVFIDGRFRVACALQYLLRSVSNDIPVMMHDFWNRECYAEILNFFDVIDKIDTMAVFLKKKRISWRNLTMCLLKFQFDPS